MVRIYLSAAAQIAEIKVPQLDLTALIKELPRNITMQHQIQLNLQQDDSYEPKYMDMNGDGYPEVLVAHHLSWTARTLIITLIILCIIVSVWLYRRRAKIRFFFADALLAKLGAKKALQSVKYDPKSPESVVFNSLDKVQEYPEVQPDV